MSDVTCLIEAAQAGDRQAANQLLPLVYDELRKLAAARMGAEDPGHTLNATALVHVAYERLVRDHHFADRSHFFRVAAEAMRRVLIDHARQKRRIRHGGNRVWVPPFDVEVAAEASEEELLAQDKALDRFPARGPVKAELVKLRYFAGFSEEEAAAILGISRATASRYWNDARASLIHILDGKSDQSRHTMRRANAKRR